MENDLTNDNQEPDNISQDQVDAGQPPIQKGFMLKLQMLPKKILLIIILSVFIIVMFIVSFFVPKIKNVNPVPNEKQGISVEQNNASIDQNTTIVQTPGDVVNKYYSFIQKNDRLGAMSLISTSSQTNTMAFVSTTQGVKNADSLYGKQFTYQITKTLIDKQGTGSYVWATTVVDKRIINHFFTLIKLPQDKEWKLINDKTGGFQSSAR